MKKRKIILIVCIIIAIIICVAPIPYRLKDGGTVYLAPIVPTYEIYVYNTEICDELGNVSYKKGCGVCVLGMEVYECTYYEAQ